MQKRTEAEWIELAGEYYSSGLRQAAFCKAKGINLYTFRDRLSRLRKTQSRDNKTVQVSPPEEVRWQPVVEEPDRVAAEIKLSVGMFEIKVTQGFDEALFQKVCRALVALC